MFPVQFFGVEQRSSRAAYGSLIGLVLAVAACGGSSAGSDADDAEPPAAPSAPASTASSTPRSTAAASSAAPASNAGAAAPSSAAGAAAPAAGAPAAAPSAAPEATAPGAAAGAAPPAPMASPQLTFAKDIWPIFNSKCGPCHVTERLGGHNVGSADLDIALGAALDRQEDILRELRSKSMPPGCARAGASADKCVSNAEIDQIASWYSEPNPS